jgi:hypothetical protein
LRPRVCKGTLTARLTEQKKTEGSIGPLRATTLSGGQAIVIEGG